MSIQCWTLASTTFRDKFTQIFGKSQKSGLEVLGRVQMCNTETGTSHEEIPTTASIQLHLTFPPNGLT
ncbi:hypothetical protein TNCV_3607511 [Trichonephila clavipes]|nr:hypothetical protein TNCV_3607511 [Trichonephila clavipes]